MQMNTVVDPVKILVIGGYGVGKSSIIRRVAELAFESRYVPTTGIDVVVLKAPLKDSASIEVSVIDVGAELLLAHPGSTMSLLCANGVDCIIVVADGGDATSILEVKRWLHLIIQHGGNKAEIRLIISKADIPAAEREFSPSKLSRVIKESIISGWSWTVSNPDFGDIDISRGCVEHQSAPEDIIRSIVHSILVQRAGNLCKLLPVPFRLEFVKYSTYPFQDVDKYFSTSSS
jgi:hypothetical protein